MIFLRTEHVADYYKKRNWEFVCKTKDGKGIDTEVFKYKINSIELTGINENDKD